MYFFFGALSVVGLSCLAGIMMSIGFVLGPYWASLPLHSFQPIFRSTGDSILRLLPYILIPTSVGLLGANWCCWNAPGPIRFLWAIAALGLIITALLTKLWFFPQNEILLSDGISAVELSQRFRIWLWVHNLRIATPLLASISGLLCIFWKRPG